MARQTREEARRETREKILEAARTSFARLGFASASVDVIAEAAGYSKGAFYSNFDSKEEIFLLLLEQHLEAEVARGQDAVTQDDFETALGRFVDHYAMDADDQDWCLLSIEFSLHAARSKTFGEHYARLYKRYYDEIAETLTRLCALDDGKPSHAYLTATKFVAFRRGLAFDRASATPTLSETDVKQALQGFLRKSLHITKP